jgi:hypothetical protein
VNIYSGIREFCKNLQNEKKIDSSRKVWLDMAVINRFSIG